MGSIHNDLASWAAKARSKGQATIEIDIATAEKASDLMIAQAEKIAQLERQQPRIGWMPVRWFHYLVPGRVAKMRASNAAYFRDNSFATYLAKRHPA